MLRRQGVLVATLMALTTGVPAQQTLQPLSREEMANARVDEVESIRDRDEISEDEIEELQLYLRRQPLRENGLEPPRQRRQQEDSGLTAFQRDFRDSLIRASGAR